MKLYIDTRSLLSIYNFSSKEEDRVRNLIRLIQNAEIILWLPYNVHGEFKSLREDVVKKLLIDLESHKIFSIPPDILKNKPEYWEHLEMQSKINKEIVALRQYVKKGILRNELTADLLIKELIQKSKKLENNDVESLVKDKVTGNLVNLFPDEPLHVITKNKTALTRSWSKRNSLRAVFYPTLAGFLTSQTQFTVEIDAPVKR